MMQIASEKEAKLTYLRRKLIRAIPQGMTFQQVKKLIGEIKELEKNMGPRKAEELRAQVGRLKPPPD